MKREVAIIPCDTNLKEAIQLIELSRYHTGFTLDDAGKYRGTVSTSDLRRLIVSGVNETDPVKAHPCSYANAVKEADLSSKEAIENVLADLALEGIEHVPVLDPDDLIVDALSVEDLRHEPAMSRAEGFSTRQRQRILIVGGAGYLGSVLASKLLARGYIVRILDNFLYGRHSLEQIPSTPALEIVEGDLRNIHTCVSALDGVHAVVLLAALVGDPA